MTDAADLPTRERALELLHQMIRVRRFEEKCAELYNAEKIRGFLHLYIGEEAVAAGAISVLEPEDAIVATYREHGHALFRGVSARALMAEMLGKVEGCCRGRGLLTVSVASALGRPPGERRPPRGSVPREDR